MATPANKFIIHGSTAEELLALAHQTKKTANESIKWEISFSDNRGWRKQYKLVVEVMQR